jgi:hypothetical protein
VRLWERRMRSGFVIVVYIAACLFYVIPVAMVQVSDTFGFPLCPSFIPHPTVAT